MFQTLSPCLMRTSDMVRSAAPFDAAAADTADAEVADAETAEAEAAEAEAPEAEANPEALAALPEPEEQPASAVAMAAVAPAPINPRLVMLFMLAPSLPCYPFGMRASKGPVNVKRHHERRMR